MRRKNRKYIVFFEPQLLAGNKYAANVKYGVACESATSYILRGRHGLPQVDKALKNKIYEIGEVKTV